MPGDATLEHWLASFAFALIRCGAAFAATPPFAGRALPLRARSAAAAATALAASGAHPMPDLALASVAGFTAAAAELVTGAAIGFVLQVAFAGAIVAGEQMGSVAGMGFESFADPLSGAHSPAAGQFLTALATLLFFAADGHLVLIRALADSYVAIPPGHWPGSARLQAVAAFGSELFAAALALALPVVAAVVAVNLALAVLTRSAPQMNLFAIGLPATVAAMAAMLALALPGMAERSTAHVGDALRLIRTLTGR
ncbi:MAG: flagellar biosynthetic protein FliR [Sphingomonadaceae bacterium]|nr:flagellar biosynthetic protein FliR [Sphingomonadaceae bacterium]